MFKERIAGQLPGDARARAGAARRARPAERRRPRRVPPRHRSARRRAGKLGALLAQFPASFKDTPGVARLPRRPAARLRRLSASPSSCGTGAGATRSATRCAAERASAPPGCRSTSRSSASRSARTTCPTSTGFYYMRLHGRNAAQWWRHEKSEDRYNYLYSAEELKEFTETADAAQAAGEEAVSLHQQSLLGEVGRQRRDDQAAARRADRRRVPAGVPRPLPGARRRHSFTYIRRITIASLAAAPARRRPPMTWPKTVYLPLRSGRVSPASRRSGCRPARGRPDAPAPRRLAVCVRLRRSSAAPIGVSARRRRARVPSPPRCDTSRDRGSPHCTRNPGSARWTRWPS